MFYITKPHRCANEYEAHRSESNEEPKSYTAQVASRKCKDYVQMRYNGSAHM